MKKPDPVVLENAFVRMEPLDERHREPLREAGNDPDLWRFANVNLDNTNFDSWMDHRLTEVAISSDLSWAVYDKASASFVGSTSYLAVTMVHKRLEIGWTWYAKRVWAGAVNPSCKRMLLAHGFDTLGLNRTLGSAIGVIALVSVLSSGAVLTSPPLARIWFISV